MANIDIRNGQAADWDALAGVFHGAVREGAVAYTQAQRAAWSPMSRAGADWSLRMTRQEVRVAEAEGVPVGFMTLEMNNYLDCAYILPRWQGRGVFRRLYQALEPCAKQAGTGRIFTHASLHAQGAFTAMGFATMRPETVKMRQADDGAQIWLPRFLMEKRL